MSVFINGRSFFTIYSALRDAEKRAQDLIIVNFCCSFLSGVANTDLVQFNIVDCPCSIFQDTAFDCILFPNAKSVIFVIDAQVSQSGMLV